MLLILNHAGSIEGSLEVNYDLRQGGTLFQNDNKGANNNLDKNKNINTKNSVSLKRCISSTNKSSTTSTISSTMGPIIGKTINFFSNINYDK